MQKLYLSLKAPSNNVKTQSDETLTTQTNFFLFNNRWKFSLMRLSNKSTKRRNSEENFKNQSTY